MSASGDRDHYINCMARWMIDDYKTRDERNAALSRIEEQHGKTFADDLRKRVMAVWRERGRVDATDAR